MFSYPHRGEPLPSAHCNTSESHSGLSYEELFQQYTVFEVEAVVEEVLKVEDKAVVVEEVLEEDVEDVEEVDVDVEVEEPMQVALGHA